MPVRQRVVASYLIWQGGQVVLMGMAWRLNAELVPHKRVAGWPLQTPMPPTPRSHPPHIWMAGSSTGGRLEPRGHS